MNKQSRETEGTSERGPRWKEDFPFKTELEEYIARRDFLRFLLVVSGGFVLGNLFVMFRSFEQTREVFEKLDLGVAEQLSPGTSRVFYYPTDKDPRILIRRLNGSFIAFDLKCPHLQCPISYEVNGKENLVCHCHNGVFDLNTGRGIQGPPREFRPLREVVLEVGERIWAVGLS
jgi:nitrite reductase/ring-hydroxylating ferredoxin subunit